MSKKQKISGKKASTKSKGPQINFPKIAVLGGGSWATALVKILCENLNSIHWYMRSESAVEHIKAYGNNPNYISSAELDPEKLLLTTDINKAVNACDWLILAIPSAFLVRELQKLKVSLEDKTIFSAIKGIVPESGLIVGEHLHEHFDIPYKNIGVIAGPCHAEEVALERLSYLTLACSDTDKAQIMSDCLRCDYINAAVSKDIIGTEYAAMLKNIYALAAGIAHGLGYGDNYQAVLMSNAIREMKRYVKRRYTIDRNINHSAYLGDLLVTGYSTFSRNRMFGTMIGKGYTVKSAMMEMNMIAEGYYATRSAYEIKGSFKKKVKTPIIDAVYHILYENKNPKKEFAILSAKMA